MTTHESWTEAQSKATVSVDGDERAVAYYEGGAEADEEEATAAEPVVFLHGIPTWSFLWRDVAPDFAEETGRRVIAPDLLGYGNSDMADSFDRSIRAQEAMVDALLAELGIDGPFSVVAHDIGGGVALRLAAEHPERVERLVLSNAVCFDSWPVEFINDLGLPSKADREPETVERELEQVFGGGVYGEPEAHRAFIDGMIEPWRSAAGRTSLVRNAVATNTNHTTSIDYGAITAETLLLWGADDVLQSIDYAERLADEVGGSARVEGLERAYHWVVEDRSEAYLAELVAFFG
ncbi:MAG: alpha/beta fold hydrolase [Halodesulfurarchaeum sp.]